MFELIELDVTTIKVADRAREDYGDLDSLKESIRDQGLLLPLIVDENHQLIAGERRLRAIQMLIDEGHDAALQPVRVMPGLSADDKMLIEMVENTTRKEFEWHEECKLRNAIHHYYAKLNGPTWSMRKTAEKIGCAHSTLSSDELLTQAIKRYPELRQCSTKRQASAQVKKLFKSAEACNTLANLSPAERNQISSMLNPGAEARSTKSKEPATLPTFSYLIKPYNEVLEEIPDHSIGFVEMDPPYAMDFQNIYARSSGKQVDFIDWSADEFKSHMEPLIHALPEKMINNSWVLCWTAVEWVTDLQLWFKSAGFNIQKPGFWVKPGGSSNSPSTNMISNYETFLLARYGDARFNTPSMTATLMAKSAPPAQRCHPTEKPIDGVYSPLFEALARPNTIFFSPFAGSGNSMITSLMFDMIPIVCDIRDDYFPACVAKLKRLVTEGRIEVSNGK